MCKNALQETSRAYSKKAQLSSAWGRIFFLYGHGEHPARLISSVITALLRGESTRCTHGAQVRNFLHVVDVASAFVALLDSAVEGAVNITSGYPITLRDVVLTAADCLGARERVQFGALPASKDDPALIVGDETRLGDEVLWEPSYDLITGIAQTVRYGQEKTA